MRVCRLLVWYCCSNEAARFGSDGETRQTRRQRSLTETPEHFTRDRRTLAAPLELGYEKRGANACGKPAVINTKACGKHCLAEERIAGKDFTKNSKDSILGKLKKNWQICLAQNYFTNYLYWPNRNYLNTSVAHHIKRVGCYGISNPVGGSPI